MNSIFLLKSTKPASSLQFSNKRLYYFDVAVETPTIRAVRKISIYTYEKTDGFAEFFQRLAEQERPWADVKVWEPLERGMRLAATCDSLGHVSIRVTFEESFASADCWSLDCTLLFDFGMLPKFAADAAKFCA